MNLAGTGWSHVNALRRKGVDARLLVFWQQKWRPDEYDINLDLPRKGLLRQQFETGVVRITANEFETALAVATGRALST